MSNAEIDFIMDAIELTVFHFQEWMKDHNYDAQSNEFSFKEFKTKEKCKIEDWFNAYNWK